MTPCKDGESDEIKIHSASHGEERFSLVRSQRTSPGASAFKKDCNSSISMKIVLLAVWILAASGTETTGGISISDLCEPSCHTVSLQQTPEFDTQGANATNATDRVDEFVRDVKAVQMDIEGIVPMRKIISFIDDEGKISFASITVDVNNNGDVIGDRISETDYEIE
jgi:hypothetical protein